MSDTELELLQLCRTLNEAEYLRDVETLSQLLADDYLGITAAGELLTKEVALERFGSPDLVFTVHQVSDIRVRVFGATGLITGMVTLAGWFGAEQFEGTFRFTDVCVRRGGTWVVVGSQTTPMPA